MSLSPINVYACLVCGKYFQASTPPLPKSLHKECARSHPSLAIACHDPLVETTLSALVMGFQENSSHRSFMCMLSLRARLYPGLLCRLHFVMLSRGETKRIILRNSTNTVLALVFLECLQNCHRLELLSEAPAKSSLLSYLAGASIASRTRISNCVESH